MNLQKPIRLMMITATMMLLSVSAYGASSDIEQETRQLISSFKKYAEEQDIDRLISLIHPRYAETFREGVRQLFESDYTPSVEFDVLDVTEEAEGVLARITHRIKWPNADEVIEKNMLYVLKPHNGQLKLLGQHEELDVDEYDPQTGILTSKKGKYEVQLPEGWIPARNPSIMSIAPDALGGMAPDLESGFLLGFLQLPMRLGDDAETAQKALEGDVALAKRVCFEHQTISQGPVRIAGMDGYESITKLRATKDSPQSIKRRRVYLSDYPMLYFFVCDAVGTEKWDRFASDFNAIVQSLEMLPLEEGMTRQETVAVELGKGTVTGRVYTSDEFNCYIAAPKGWEMGTNPNPAHLVEMQYSKGSSFARLIAAKGIPDSMLVNEAFSTRLNQVKGIVQDFSESSRRDVIVQETPAIESIHSYSIEGVGTFHVKEVTVIRDNIYYLILCQCMEPDDFEVLEKDFDTIIQSFGFIQ